MNQRQRNRMTETYPMRDQMVWRWSEGTHGTLTQATLISVERTDEGWFGVVFVVLPDNPFQMDRVPLSQLYPTPAHAEGHRPEWMFPLNR